MFGLLTDIDRLAEWNHIITRVLHRPTDLAPGAEWVVEMHAMGQTWPSRSRVEAIDRPTRRFSYRSGTDDANPSYTLWHWSIEPHPGGSLVSVSWDLNPRTFWRRHLVVHLRRRALAQEVPPRSVRWKPQPNATRPSPRVDRCPESRPPTGHRSWMVCAWGDHPH